MTNDEMPDVIWICRKEVNRDSLADGVWFDEEGYTAGPAYLRATPARKRAQERIAELEQAQRWIPVGESWPEPHTHFLALNRDGYIFESCMCYGLHRPWFTYPRGDGNASNTLPDWIDVIAWMPKPPLPPPPGEEGW